MRARTILVLLLLGTLLVPKGREAQAQGAHPLKGRNTVSAPVAFLLSDRGRELLRQSSSPLAIEALRLFHGEESSIAPAAEATAPASVGAEREDPGVTAVCNAAFGTKFNLEGVTNAITQNEESVDYIRGGGLLGADLAVAGANDYRGLIAPLPFQSNLGFSATGYYVDRNGNCIPDFEGGLPPIDDPLEAGACNTATGLPVTGCLLGGGDPVVAADPVRHAFFFADLRFDSSTTGIGVFRNTQANLNSGVACPSVTHTLLLANTCFSGLGTARRVVAAVSAAGGQFQDKPHLAVDERSTGTGAGNVYIAFTHFPAVGPVVIQLVNCNNALTVCSAPQTISGLDATTQFAHVTVRTNGVVALTWINGAGTTTHTIRHRQCAAPAAPGGVMACGPISTVHTETQALPLFGFLAAQDFRIATYPVHDHRIVAGANITTVVWSRCKTPLFLGAVCLDADVVMKEAAAPAGVVGAPAWPAALTCVDCGANDQIFPWVRTDRTRNITAIAYYTSVGDVQPQHRLQVRLAHRAGFGLGATLDIHPLTTVLTDPCGDPVVGCTFIGDYIGVASRGNGLDGGTRDYVGHTYYAPGSGFSGGVVYPNSNNHMSRFDH